MQTDPPNDALVKIHNAEQAGNCVNVTPASKLLGNALEIMQKAGYVGEYEEENGRGSISHPTSWSNQSLCCNQAKAKRKETRFRKLGISLLPAQDFGLLIINNLR